MIVVSQSGPWPALKPAMVTGMSSSELAKIGGMTPEVLSLSGRCEFSPPTIRLPLLALGILDDDAPLGALHEHDEGDDHAAMMMKRDDDRGRQRAVPAELEQLADRGRQVGDDARRR